MCNFISQNSHTREKTIWVFIIKTSITAIIDHQTLVIDYFIHIPLFIHFQIMVIDHNNVEAMPSKVILMMSKNQFKIQEPSFKNQDSRIIKIKIQDSRFKNQEKTQSR